MSNKNLKSFCDLVLASLYEHPGTFTNPPIAVDEYVQVYKAFNLAVGKYEVAPKVEKTNMLQAKEKMVGVLDTLSGYVNTVSNGDADIITLAGFTPTKGTTEKSKPLDRYGNFDLKRNDAYGKVTAKIVAYPLESGVKYMMVCTKQAELPENFVVDGVFDFSLVPDALFALNNGRVKVFSNLEAGTVYYFYLFISNAVSISPPSLPKSFKM